MKLKPSLDWLLIFVPLAILLRFWPGGISPTALFVCSALGIIPVAGWIGRATEALAARVGEGLGGLLNATFGNAAELIIAGIALSKGLTNVVKASITGSIIGNVLLVLGLSILMGGTKYKEQRFNRTAATSSVISLSLAAIGLIIPTVFHRAADRTPGGWSPLVEQKLSLGIAVVMFLTYFCMLAFLSPDPQGSLPRRWGTRRNREAMVAQQGYYHPAHRYRLCRPAFGVSRRDDRKRSGLRRPHRGVCRCYRGGDCGQRGRALDRHPHGDEKQDGPERRYRDRLQPANRAFRRAGADFSLLRFWATDGPGIYPAGSGRGRGLGLRPVSDQ